MHPIVPAVLFAALWLFLIIRTFLLFRNENKRITKQLADDHHKNINDTVLVSDCLSEEEVGVFYSERPFFDCYKSLN